jgi:uncharacterized membrane protein YvlD (DUF360 family)
MSLLFSIILNWLLLFWIWIYLNNGFDWIWNMPVIYTCFDSTDITCQIKSLIMWGFVLWLINFLVKPILRTFQIPVFYLTVIILTVFLNLVSIVLFKWMMQALEVNWLWVNINWAFNLLFIVAIFAFFNTIYNILFVK